MANHEKQTLESWNTELGIVKPCSQQLWHVYKLQQWIRWLVCQCASVRFALPRRVCVSVLFFFFFLAEKFDFSINFQSHVDPVYCLETYKFYFLTTFFIKNGSHGTIYIFKKYFATVFFSFQFAVFSCIQTD